MSQQLQITGGAKVRDLQDVIIGTSGVLSSLAFNVANGVPKLDSNGKILVSQLPNSVMEYQGTWNANTNTPTLVNGTGNQGDFYLCNVAGTTNFGAGPLTFAVGDSAIYSGSIWQKAGGATGTVTSVGLTSTGNDAITITGSPITTSGNINLGFAGTNLQYINGTGDLTTFPTLISSIGLSMPSAFSVANSPLTANGTIAVTGAGNASQYIRGDGTLAAYNPSTGGGGSSVSYYLNGGTNQGTFVGNTYYEMSKTAVIGTGVDFTINANGYISQFITDANDPAQLVIPAGNWNFEMYFSASSSGGSPSFYVELYKYNGSTFTLIADNSANPEYITNGTAIDLYTTAVAVPETSLTITDRLAIRVYVTHASKTITLHTQDSHLCQVITTFSTGITALNGLTAQVQYFATGTSGTDFNISSSTATHTFNIPSASATNRGLITTGTQTIAGAKTFTSLLNVNNKIYLQTDLASTGVYFQSYNSNELSIGATSGATVYYSSFILQYATRSYTLPNADGTIALTSNLSSYVPYTGATADVNLGIYSITGAIGTFTNGVLNGNGTNPANLYLKKGSFPFFTNAANYGLIAAVSSSFILISDVDGTNYKYASFNLGSLNNNTNRAYTLPDDSGTLALLESTQTFTGTNTFTQNLQLNGNGSNAGTLLLKSNTVMPVAIGYSSINSNANIINLITYVSATKNAALDLSGLSDNITRTFTFPNASGTIALTSSLSSYVPYTGATGDVNLGTYDLSSYAVKANILEAKLNGTASSPLILRTGTSGFASGLDAISLISSPSSANTLSIISDVSSVTKRANIGLGSLSATRTYTLPDVSGTLSLLESTQTFSGVITFSSNISVSGVTIGKGRQAGTGADNIALGNTSLQGNTTGERNTSIGSGALYTNTTGTDNIALGYQSLFLNTTGSSNIAMGVNTLGDNTTGINNIGIGISALDRNTTADGNIAIGYGALNLNTTGAYNTTVGYIAGSAITTGSYNTIVGRYVGTTTMSSNIVLADGQGNIRFRYDGTNTFLSGSVAIGSTTSPSYTLDVSGTGKFGGTSTYNGFLISSHSNNVGAAITNKGLANATLYADSASTVLNAETNLYLRTGNTDRLTITSGGNVGIGTSSPNARLSLGRASYISTSIPSLLVYDGGYIANGGNGYFAGFTIDQPNGGDFNMIATHEGAIVFSKYTSSSNTTAITERMRITSGGKILANRTTSTSTDIMQIETFITGAVYSDAYGIMVSGNGNYYANYAMRFYNTYLGTYVGSISFNSTNTAFNTSSDYRLKEDLKDYSGLDVVSKIKTYDFKWKSTEERMYGVLAHELAEILPYAVMGKKDAEFEDGKINPQGADYSKLVPVLVKAIQELSKQNEELSNRLIKLESK
jgi:hypothetical protein